MKKKKPSLSKPKTVLLFPVLLDVTPKLLFYLKNVLTVLKISKTPPLSKIWPPKVVYIKAFNKILKQIYFLFKKTTKN